MLGSSTIEPRRLNGEPSREPIIPKCPKLVTFLQRITFGSDNVMIKSLFVDIYKLTCQPTVKITFYGEKGFLGKHKGPRSKNREKVSIVRLRNLVNDQRYLPLKETETKRKR